MVLLARSFSSFFDPSFELVLVFELPELPVLLTESLREW